MGPQRLVVEVPRVRVQAQQLLVLAERRRQVAPLELRAADAGMGDGPQSEHPGTRQDPAVGAEGGVGGGGVELGGLARGQQLADPPRLRRVPHAQLRVQGRLGRVRCGIEPPAGDVQEMASPHEGVAAGRIQGGAHLVEPRLPPHRARHQGLPGRLQGLELGADRTPGELRVALLVRDQALARGGALALHGPQAEPAQQQARDEDDGEQHAGQQRRASDPAHGASIVHGARGPPPASRACASGAYGRTLHAPPPDSCRPDHRPGQSQGPFGSRRLTDACSSTTLRGRLGHRDGPEAERTRLWHSSCSMGEAWMEG
jgi:hypothetical protein